MSKLKKALKRLESLIRLGRELFLRRWVWKKREYQPFIILGAGRTGTNLLIQYLRSHPGVVCYNEVLHLHKPIYGYPHLDHFLKESGDRLRKQSAARFLEQCIFGPRSRKVKAAGFKYIYWHGEGEGWQKNNNAAVLGIAGLKVLHLRRRNKLDQFVSEKVARQQKSWSSEQAAGANNTRISIAPEEFKAFVPRITALEEKYEALFGHMPMHSLYYEDLVQKPREEMDAVFVFLGLEKRAVQTRTNKLITLPRRMLIENHEELAGQFKDTPFALFLEEDTRPAAADH